MAEEIIHLLEPVEVEAKDGELPAGDLMGSNLFVQPLGEGVPIGQAGESVVMCKKVYACLGPLAVPQIPDRNRAMYFAREIDGPLDDLHRDHHPVSPPQHCLEWLVRTVFRCPV